MTNMIFYVLLLSMSATFMTGSIRFSGVSRTFMLLQRSIMEYSVITCDENNSPYYDQSLMKKGVDDYFAANLPRYVTKYTTGICYLNDDGSVCINGYCQSVRISLKADVDWLFRFDKAMVFTISSLEGTGQ